MPGTGPLKLRAHDIEDLRALAGSPQSGARIPRRTETSDGAGSTRRAEEADRQYATEK